MGRYDFRVSKTSEVLKTGLDAFQKGEYSTAVNAFLPLARRGNATAQYYVGRMYHEGKGFPEDNEKAALWVRRGADRGSAEAEGLLGTLFSQGHGVAKNDGDAARCFHQAARRGNAVGQAQMGLCYMRGIGVPQDYAQAYMWFDLAASRSTGHDRACNENLRDVLAGMHLSSAEIAKARRLAGEWRPEHPSLWQRLHLS